jgi:anti-sigma factor RsiW
MTDADHETYHLLVQADHDGELSPAEAADLVAHLDGCAECRAVRADLSRLSARLRAELPRHAAPAALRASLEAQLGVAPTVVPFRPRARPWRALGLVAGGALAMAASITLWVPPRADPMGEMVASHIRALQPGHLTDVVSTDQHTVKPWFDGRIDYAPPVRDFSAAGFPLVGGRLDYLGGRAVAALVYRRDKHVIDLFVWPAAGDTAPRAHTTNGYNVVAWADGGMRFQAVSDLNAAELGQFATLWRESGS